MAPTANKKEKQLSLIVEENCIESNRTRLQKKKIFLMLFSAFIIFRRE